MKKYLLKKIIVAFITILITILLSFILLHLIPGSPFQKGKIISDTVELKLIKYYGLDQPILKQFITYLGNIMRFNFGYSFQYTGLSVNSIILKSFPVSAALGLLAYLISYPIGVILGAISAHNEGNKIDKLLVFLSAIFSAFPVFVVATLLQYVFAIKLHIFPIALLKSFKSFILPSLSLSIVLIAARSRQMRTLFLEILNNKYIINAKSKGLPKLYVFLNYELKNVLIPLISTMGIELVSVLTGSVIIEQIFSLPGLGAYYIQSIQGLDYFVVLGITVFYIILLTLFNLIVDILYGIIDPRIRNIKGATK